MSQRKLIRNIAKARLAALGVEHINKKFSLGLTHTEEQNFKRTERGRELLRSLQEKHEPLWRRVAYGDLAKDGYNAQMGANVKGKPRVAV